MQNDWKVQVLYEDKIIKYENIEYHIGQQLGAGASAKVFRSQKFINQQKQNQDVALRIQNRYYKQNYEQWNQLKDFKWRNTTYPIENIPGSFLFTEFELFEGNLTMLDSQQIKENIFLIADTIAQALLEIHNSQYIHFDVKPDNIVFKKIEQQYKFALCDFSSIQPIHKAIEGGLYIEATPQFAAPEIEIQGQSKDADQSSDIWSLGMTLYCLYSKNYMFNQENLNSNKDQYYIDNLVDEYIDNERLKQLILRSLRVDKKERITAKEMIEIIKNPTQLIQAQPQKQRSQNMSSTLYNTGNLKQEKVKQPNLLTVPTLEGITMQILQILQSDNQQKEQDQIVKKKLKKSCLLEMPLQLI